MKALVTGANGFTGSYLTKHLLDQGYQVRALVRKKADLSNLHDLDIEYAYADLGETADLSDDVMRDIDVVHHVAAVFRAENVPKQHFFDVNAGGTKRLLQAAKRSNVKRFIHCSTVGVQGNIKHPPATEDHPYGPGDYYQESKLEGELLARSFFESEGLPGVVVRPAGIYGPGDMRFHKLFKFIDTGKFRMIGSGSVLYHLTYVTDLVAGMTLAGEHEEALGQVFTIGGEEHLTLLEFVEKIATILNKRISTTRIPVWPVWSAGLLCEILCKPLGITPPLYRRRVDFFIKDRAFDISRAKKVLGYQPKVAVNYGLVLTANWYRQNGLL